MPQWRARFNLVGNPFSLFLGGGGRADLSIVRARLTGVGLVEDPSLGPKLAYRWSPAGAGAGAASCGWSVPYGFPGAAAAAAAASASSLPRASASPLSAA